MKSLTLMRHAKAAMDSPDGSDFGRPLNARGRADAVRMGEDIRKFGIRFDLVLASPARRVVETVESVGPLTASLDPRLYNASTGQLLDVIREIDDGVDRLLMVGHNPGIGQLAAQLTASGIDDFPTAALAEIELTVDDWREVEMGSGRLIRFITPNDLA